MISHRWIGAVAALAVMSVGAWAAEPARVGFQTLRETEAAQARSQALRWLEDTGKADADLRRRAEAVWADESASVLDRVADTLALGDAEAAALLKAARDPAVAAPTEVPALLRDVKRPVFFRANLALAYARALGNRRVYEESLEALRVVRPDQVVDPASYYFQRSVAEHALQLRPDALRSISALLEDVSDGPARYQHVAGLMLLEMAQWKARDLAAIGRLMSNVERRLELARGGAQTQKQQKEIVARLDELIRELEPRDDEFGPPTPPPPNPRQPMERSRIARQDGPGEVPNIKLERAARQWGKLPDSERARAIQELARDLPPRYREIIENYFRKLAERSVEVRR